MQYQKPVWWPSIAAVVIVVITGLLILPNEVTADVAETSDQPSSTPSFSDEPTYTPWNGHTLSDDKFLTKDETAQILRDKDQVLANDPDLKQEDDALKVKGRQDHNEKLKAAMVKIDPTLATLFAHWDAWTDTKSRDNQYRLEKARDQALTNDPDLKKENDAMVNDTMVRKGKGPTTEDEKLAEQNHGEKIYAAMQEIDPTLAPILENKSPEDPMLQFPVDPDQLIRKQNQIQDVRDQVLAHDLDLKQENDALINIAKQCNFKKASDAGKALEAHAEKMKAAIVNIDPTLAPTFAEFAATEKSLARYILVSWTRCSLPTAAETRRSPQSGTFSAPTTISDLQHDVDLATHNADVDAEDLKKEETPRLTHTPAEIDHLWKVRDQVLASDPDLKQENDAISNVKRHGFGNASDRATAAVQIHVKKMEAAMLMIDPTLASIFANFEKENVKTPNVHADALYLIAWKVRSTSSSNSKSGHAGKLHSNP